MPFFINDGYTFDAKIPAHKGTPEVKYKYRPALPERLTEYFFDHNSAGDGKAQHANRVKFLKEHLVSWDAKDGSESVAKIDDATLSRVPYPIVMDMVNEILSYGTGQAEADAKN